MVSEQRSMALSEGSNPPIELPIFNGQDPEEWIVRAEQFFSMYLWSDSHKIAEAASKMEGEARIWFEKEDRRWHFRSWREMKSYLLDRFRREDIIPEDCRVRELPLKNSEETQWSDLWEKRPFSLLDRLEMMIQKRVNEPASILSSSSSNPDSSDTAATDNIQGSPPPERIAPAEASPLMEISDQLQSENEGVTATEIRAEFGKKTPSELVRVEDPVCVLSQLTPLHTQNQREPIQLSMFSSLLRPGLLTRSTWTSPNPNPFGTQPGPSGLGPPLFFATAASASSNLFVDDDAWVDNIDDELKSAMLERQKQTNVFEPNGKKIHKANKNKGVDQSVAPTLNKVSSYKNAEFLVNREFRDSNTMVPNMVYFVKDMESLQVDSRGMVDYADSEDDHVAVGGYDYRSDPSTSEKYNIDEIFDHYPIQVVDCEDLADGRLISGFSELMDFINDALVNAYKPVAVYFSCLVEMSHRNGELLRALARLHDSMLPSLQGGFRQIFSTGAVVIQNSNVGKHPNVVVGLKMLSMRIVNAGWKLLESRYSINEVIERTLPLPTSTKMSPSKADDPGIRGDLLVQTFKEINREVSCHVCENKNREIFLQNVEKHCSILSRFNDLRSQGWFFMDDKQFQYLSLNAIPLTSHAMSQESVPVSGVNKVQMEEDVAVIKFKISQVYFSTPSPPSQTPCCILAEPKIQLDRAKGLSHKCGVLEEENEQSPDVWLIFDVH